MSENSIEIDLYPDELERKAFQQVVRIFSRRDYTRSELLKKLKERDVEEANAIKAIEKLIRLGLYNEDTILRNLVRRYAVKGNAPRAITYLLKSHGLEVDYAKVLSVYEELDLSYKTNLEDFLEKKMKNRTKDLKTREYLLRQALNKGYSLDEAKKVIEKFIPSPF